MGVGDGKVEISLIDLVSNATVKNIMETLEDGERDALIRAALIEQIAATQEGLGYKVSRAIGDAINLLAIERLQDPEVLALMRAKAHVAVDKVIEGFAETAADSLSTALQSEYRSITGKRRR